MIVSASAASRIGAALALPVLGEAVAHDPAPVRQHFPREVRARLLRAAGELAFRSAAIARRALPSTRCRRRGFPLLATAALQ